MNSFTNLCQPFASALQELHASNKQHSTTMLRAAICAFATFSYPIPSILCHALFLSFPITSPMVVDLLACIRSENIPLCLHCRDELEQAVLFLQKDFFTRTEFPNLALIKDQSTTDLPKITSLGDPHHLPSKYDAKLLHSTIIDQSTRAPTHASADEPLYQHQVAWKDFFCGSHSLHKQSQAIFSQKVCFFFFPPPSPSSFLLLSFFSYSFITLFFSFIIPSPSTF